MSILIIGAGPTGLTLALALRQRGLSCRLVDRELEPGRQSRALAVQARTLEVLERLGLAAPMLAEAQRLRGLALHGGDGAVSRLDFPSVHPRLPPVVVLPQARTEALLLGAGAAPERGVECLGLEHGAALLRHPDGQVERAEAEWIIGCDGAHSAVRHALGAGFAGRAYPQQLLLADGRLEGLEPDRLHVFPEAAHMLAFIPMPGGLWRGIVILPPAAEAPEEGSLAPFTLPGIRLRAPVWWSAFRISRRQVEHYRHGRVLLAGDAAHIHSPAGGQGMNLGMQDAWALAAALARGEAAVDAWAAERHAVAHRVLIATDLVTRLVTGRGPVAALLRGAGFGMLALFPALGRRAVHALAGLDYPAPAP
ncbi:MAG: FAD-dependent monooxygenase [Acetobacteraceae bacterium]|nr:FAD-dependent monooxygenase [Acetobacteraceae bacterium]MDI3309561.1 FAD-dependent monooxygenase [Acetobacteraceae bacterium]